MAGEGLTLLRNLWYTKLTADVSASATTLNVADTTNLPTPGIVILGLETVYYTSKTSITITGCIRGFDNTTAATHAKGATVGQAMVAAHHNDVVAALGAISSARIAQTIVAGSPAASVTFSSIPGTYSALMIIGLLRSSVSATNDTAYIRVLGDASAIYDSQSHYAVNTTVTAAEAIAATFAAIALCPGGTSPALSAGSFTLMMPGYASAALTKSWRSNWHHKTANASGGLASGSHSGGWRQTTAITSITFALLSGSIEVGSQITLIGIP